MLKRNVGDSQKLNIVFFSQDKNSENTKFVDENIFVWHLNLFYIFLCRLRLNRHGFSDFLHLCSFCVMEASQKLNPRWQQLCIKRSSRQNVRYGWQSHDLTVKSKKIFILSIRASFAKFNKLSLPSSEKQFGFASSWQNFFPAALNEVNRLELMSR